MRVISVYLNVCKLFNGRFHCPMYSSCINLTRPLDDTFNIRVIGPSGLRQMIMAQYLALVCIIIFVYKPRRGRQRKVWSRLVDNLFGSDKAVARRNRERG